MSYAHKKFLRALMRKLGHHAILGDYMYAQYKKHPQSDSLIGYHYVLSWMGIENLGVHVSSETLSTELPLPAIVHLIRNNGEFVIVEKIDQDIVIMNNGEGTERLKRENFDSIFSGNCIVMAADSELVINRKDFIQWLICHLSTYILPLFVIIAILLRLFISGSINVFEILFTILFGVGLTASALLFSKQEGAKTKLADSICKSGGETTNCNAVTSSKGGKLFGVLSWSDIGVIYFAAALIAVLLFGYEKLKLIIGILSVVSIPYAIYSLWYQWRIVRSWCPLCLVVQSVFMGQLIVSIISFDGNFHIYLLPSIGFMLVGIIIASLFFVIKPFISRSIKYQYVENAYTRFRNNPSVRSLLLDKKTYDTSAVNQIVFNPESDNIITFVFSTFCGPCTGKIKQLLSFLDKYDVGLRVIFHLKDYDKPEERSIVEYFISEYLVSPDKFRLFMKDFAENSSVIRQKYKSYHSSQSEIIDRIISIHKQWIDINGIIATPVIIYKNIEIGGGYNLDDLEIMILQEQ